MILLFIHDPNLSPYILYGTFYFVQLRNNELSPRLVLRPMDKGTSQCTKPSCILQPIIKFQKTMFCIEDKHGIWWNKRALHRFIPRKLIMCLDLIILLKQRYSSHSHMILFRALSKDYVPYNARDVGG
ncbi:hypothetical protein TorRG33x02_350390 [Trema orientale]|uniref:Uncharacterized protein n=1 Tax=Trema orientale TaxID=63057 RepID=A0A2P5AHD0_TREOI|nr:hypothetical protein TorRG33x02_350390 [Trema orientale]